MRRLAALLLIIASPLAAQTALPDATHGLDVKWMRDSDEYATLTRQVYRTATTAVEAASSQLAPGSWAVVLDVDETSLDNSFYMLERAAYGVAYSEDSWHVWTRRRAATRVPGVGEFIAAVRRLGGHVAWVTNRSREATDDTRANLQSTGLWNDDDRLCVITERSYTKGQRRDEVLSGAGRCSWPGLPLRVLAYLGDQMGDFPRAGERDPDAGRDDVFGTRFFLLPNPTYGNWTSRVTRREP